MMETQSRVYTDDKNRLTWWQWYGYMLTISWLGLLTKASDLKHDRTGETKAAYLGPNTPAIAPSDTSNEINAETQRFNVTAGTGRRVRE